MASSQPPLPDPTPSGVTVTQDSSQAAQVCGAVPVPVSGPVQGRLQGLRPGVFPCPHCQGLFKDIKGLSVHQRSVHGAAYHAANVPLPLVRPRWTDEELALVAREEVRIRGAGLIGVSGRRRGGTGVNQLIVARLPGRSLDAIKGARRQARYKAILQQVEQTPLPLDESEPETEPETVNSVTAKLDGAAGLLYAAAPSSPMTTMLVQVASASSPQDSQEWFPNVELTTPEGSFIEGLQNSQPPLGDLCAMNREVFCLDDPRFVDLMTLVNHTGTRGAEESLHLQELLDAEYEGWVKELCDTIPRTSTGGAGGRNHPPGPAQPRFVSSNRRRRLRYARLQRLYKKDRSKAAASVLSGDWEKEPVSVPLEEH
jgi:hypothetical protein